MEVSQTPRSHRASEAVASLELGNVLAGRFTRQLDQLFHARRRGSATFRALVREVAAELQVRGAEAEEAAARLRRVIEAHAIERGWTARSVVTGQPRYADLALQVSDWALRRPRLSRPVSTAPTVDTSGYR